MLLRRFKSSNPGLKPVARIQFFQPIRSRTVRKIGFARLFFSDGRLNYHIVCEVPEPVELSDAELLTRVEALYGTARRDEVERQLQFWSDEVGAPDEAQKIRDRFLRTLEGALWV